MQRGVCAESEPGKRPWRITRPRVTVEQGAKEFVQRVGRVLGWFELVVGGRFARVLLWPHPGRGLHRCRRGTVWERGVELAVVEDALVELGGGGEGRVKLRTCLRRRRFFSRFRVDGGRKVGRGDAGSETQSSGVTRPNGAELPGRLHHIVLGKICVCESCRLATPCSKSCNR